MTKLGDFRNKLLGRLRTARRKSILNPKSGLRVPAQVRPWPSEITYNEEGYARKAQRVGCKTMTFTAGAKTTRVSTGRP